MSDDGSTSIAALLDDALDAVERGDTSSAVELATEVLRRDPTNAVARQLIEEAGVAPGEMRRLAILFADLVGSTGLSIRIDTESYRRIVRRYHRECEHAITDHGGRVARKTGDGVLAFFGHPTSHEDDTARAVRAALAIIRRIAAVRPDIEREFSETIDVRAAVHLGPVHLDLIDSEIYGLAPNLAARLQDLAAPNTVAVSDAVVELVGDLFELEDHGYRTVKGVDEPIRHHTVIAELAANARTKAPAPTPFFSRLKELDAACGVVGVDPADTGHTGVVVRGEPGMGKTRTVLEALGRTDDPTRRVLWMICSADDRSNEFGAAASLLRLDPAISSLQGPTERLSQLKRHLRSLGLDLEAGVPLLAPLLGIAPEVGYTPAEADLTVLRSQILGALREWLDALARRSPVVIAVDDLQWADDATVELLAGVIGAPIDQLKVIATERAGSRRIVDDRLLELELEPFSMMEATRLAHSVAGHLGDDELERVLDRGQGNPLFVQELARNADSPTPPEIGPEAMTQLETATVVPRPLYEPLLARLYGSGTDIGLAQAAATIGRNFRLDTLQAVSDRSRPLVERGLRSLIDGGLVERDDQHQSFWFRHVLIRDLAYDLMPAEQREHVHGRVADALRAEREGGRQVAWSTIARHLHSALRTTDAASAYESAADEARERGALDLGYQHLSEAIGLLADGDSERLRLRLAEIRLRRAFLSVSQGGNADPRAAEDYEACLELTGHNDTGPEFVGTLVALYSYYAAKGDLRLADEMVTRIRATGITEDPDMLDESFATEGIVRWFEGDFNAAERCFETSRERTPSLITPDRELSRWQLPQDTEATAELHMGMSRWQMGDAAGFGERVRRATHRAQDLPFPYGPFSSLYVLTYKVLVLNEMGRFDRATTETARGVELSDTHQLSFWPIALDAADAVTEAGRELVSDAPDPEVLRAAADRLGGAALLYRMVGTVLVVPYVLTFQAKALVGVGDLDAADAALDEAMALAEETGSNWYTAETHRIRAQVMAGRGAPVDDVTDGIRRAAALARRQGSVPFEARALHELRSLGIVVPRLDELLARPGAALSAGLEPSAVQ